MIPADKDEGRFSHSSYSRGDLKPKHTKFQDTLESRPCCELFMVLPEVPQGCCLATVTEVKQVRPCLKEGHHEGYYEPSGNA